MFVKTRKQINKIKHLLYSIKDRNNKDNEYFELKKVLDKVKYKRFSKEEMDSLQWLKENTKKLEGKNTKVSYQPFSEEEKKVKDVYFKSASPEEWCQLYYILTREIKAINVLEIGTNLGVSGQYFIKGLNDINEKQKRYFITFEGVRDFCQIAKDMFDSIKHESNISYNIIEGVFSDTLDSGVLKKDVLYDIVFIDGNHSYKATKEYFDKFRVLYNENCIVIFDDINWSEEMKTVWREIVQDDNIKYSIDLYKLGIVVYGQKTNNNNKLHYFFKL